LNCCCNTQLILRKEIRLVAMGLIKGARILHLQIIFIIY
jgi:hypothetical protein